VNFYAYKQNFSKLENQSCPNFLRLKLLNIFSPFFKVFLNMIISLPDVFSNLLPGALTCLSCLWFFFKYFFQTNKNIGFSLIFVLTLSDFFFSLTVIISLFFPYSHLGGIYHVAIFISLQFSIFWASAMSYLVYKSLKNKDFNTWKSFWTTIIVLLSLALAFAIL